MDAQQNGRQLEIDEEYDDAEVDERMRCRNQFGLFVQYENDRCNDGCFCVAVLAREEEDLRKREIRSFSSVV